jgi:hypothetical protein
MDAIRVIFDTGIGGGNTGLPALQVANAVKDELFSLAENSSVGRKRRSPSKPMRCTQQNQGASAGTTALSRRVPLLKRW